MRTSGGRRCYSKLVLACLLVLGCVLQVSCRGKAIQRALTSPGVVLPIGSFDAPAANSAVKSQITVTGWAAHQSGITFVAIYVDGVYFTNASLGVDRPDVRKALSQFNASMIGGWEAGLDTSEWSAGPHTVIAKAVSEAGIDRDFSVSLMAVK